jgi:DNA invertase Pin-like site-specific DNA recombinase
MKRITKDETKHRWKWRKMKAKTKIAVGYVRLSDRAADGTEISIERQESEIRSWCDRNGMQLVAVHADAGQSGKKLKRKGLDAAVSDCVLRGGVLVAYSLDRIARDRRVLERLQAERVPFRCLDLPEMNETLLALVQFVGEIYTRNISDKMKAYHAHRKAQVKAGTATPHPVPTYRPDAEAGRQSIEHARRARVERTSKRAGYVWEHIRPLVAEGKSFRQIAAELNSAGITASRGGDWHAAGVARIVARHSAAS